MKNAASLLFVIILLITTNAFAQEEKMRIAVADFKAKGVSKSLSQNVSELIRNEMINSGEFVVIERSQMDEVINEQGFQQTGCSDVSCAVELGKLLSANKILVGTVMKMGDSIIITGRIVDVEKGVGEFSESHEVKSEKEMYEGVKAFSAKLSERIVGETPIVTYTKVTVEPDQTEEDISDEETTSEENDVPEKINRDKFPYDPWYASFQLALGGSGPNSAFDLSPRIEISNSYGKIIYISALVGSMHIFPFSDPTFDFQEAENLYNSGVLKTSGVVNAFLMRANIGLSFMTHSGSAGFRPYVGIGYVGGKASYYYYQEDLTFGSDPFWQNSISTNEWIENKYSYGGLIWTVGFQIPLRLIDPYLLVYVEYLSMPKIIESEEKISSILFGTGISL